MDGERRSLVREIAGWSSKLQENHRSFQQKLQNMIQINEEQLKDINMNNRNISTYNLSWPINPYMPEQSEMGRHLIFYLGLRFIRW